MLGLKTDWTEVRQKDRERKREMRNNIDYLSDPPTEYSRELSLYLLYLKKNRIEIESACLALFSPCVHCNFLVESFILKYFHDVAT